MAIKSRPVTQPTIHTRHRLSRSEALAPYVLLIPGLLVIAVLSIYPLVYLLDVSLRSYYLAAPETSRWVGLGNYISAFQDTNFWGSVWVSVRYIVLAVAIEMVLGFAIALLLFHPIRFLGLWRTALLIPIILTPIVVGANWKLMFNTEFGVVPFLLGQLGIQSLYLAGPGSALWTVLLVEIWQWTPFVTLICMAGLATLPSEPLEAAEVDGASQWQVIRFILLPLMVPFLTIALVLRFIATFKAFDLIYIMTGGGPGVSTQVLVMRVYEQGFVDLQVGKAAALAVMLLIVAILITKFFIAQVLAMRPQEEQDA